MPSGSARSRVLQEVARPAAAAPTLAFSMNSRRVIHAIVGLLTLTARTLPGTRPAKAGAQCLEQLTVVVRQLPEHRPREVLSGDVLTLQPHRLRILVGDPLFSLGMVQPRHLRDIVPVPDVAGRLQERLGDVPVAANLQRARAGVPGLRRLDASPPASVERNAGDEL